jgi:putative glutathione S-transferase
MITDAPRISLGREASEDGAFKRQESRFRRWVSADGSTEFPLEPGRYHLYVSRACPWAHRTIIARRLMGLEDVIGISLLDPLRDARGWAFTGGEYSDAVAGFRLLSEAYHATDPDYDARVTVPVLWDIKRGVIVCNESADILRMLGTVFTPLADHPVELYPEAVRAEIDLLNERIYDGVNNAVYKAGLSTRQSIYEREVADIFATLDELDGRLCDRRFLFGGTPVETDWRLFTTLVRFDAVYLLGRRRPNKY